MGQGQSSIPTTEVAALVELYDALNGDRWRRRDGWKQPTRDPEQWFGVEVAMGHVVALELPANELSGCLPAASLARLPQLRVLDLSKNQLRGEIPAELGTLSNLKRVDFSCNDLMGAIPRQIGDCGLLQELNLYQNSLSGTMPKELGKLQSLRTLQLQHNNLCGALPEALCELTQLTKFSVRGNCLTGRIPADIGRMQSLVFLSLRNNELTGIIPPPIGCCKALEFLNLSSNQLSGPIPETLGDLEDLEYLYLFDNALEGRVPGSIARLKFLKESDFRDNRLRGELPNFLDGCSSLEAVMTKWKTRKASYRHAILGDPMPSPDTPPTSSHQFLQTLEDPPSNSSATFLSPSFDHKGSSDEPGVGLQRTTPPTIPISSPNSPGNASSSLRCRQNDERDVSKVTEI
ncbi:Leucine-rich repeat domain, L domain-like [Phytophthora cactorum]|nr:Leucine-rich repeat domain, L domain-like [Phytophthora cactorum]